MNAITSAQSAVARAKRSGALVVPAACEECGNEGRVEAAHFNYHEPLRVRWLCRGCHCRWDRADPKTRGLRLDRIYVRISFTQGLYEQIAALARSERRTFSAQLEVLLERALP